MKRKNGIATNNNKNNAIVGILVFALLLVTGILPAVLELVFGLIFGVIGLIFGMFGLVIGLVAGIFGLIIGLAPILIPVGIVYLIVQRINSNDVPMAKRKNDEAYI